MPEARLLIVEDERIIARDLQLTLEQLGYCVVAAVGTGGEAIARAQADQPDLVLMDIALADEVDGIQAASDIRERLEIPVVFLTAHADEATLERAKVTEPFGYVLKPFDERELHTAILMALHKHKIERELRRSRQWLATTLHSIGDAVIATDHSGRIVLMNPVAEQLTGWQETEAAGRPLSEIFVIINEQSRRSVANPVVRVLQEGVVVGLANHTLLISRDSTERPVDDSAAPIRDADGAMLGVVLVFRDITERRRLDAALEHHARQLEAAHRRKDEFLAMLAHELRNPLAPIWTGLELLKNAPDQPDVVSTMRTQVKHLKRLVDDLLDVSRITRGQIQLRKQPVELATMIGRAVEMTRAAIEEKKQKLSVSLPSEPVRLDADAVRLTQAFVNLLGNATKYSPRRSTIRLIAQRSGENVVVRVRDEGIGIDPDWLPRIFEAFTQAEQSLERSQSGLGIGLTLTQSLVKMHGGEIEAHSEGAGCGSEFRVSLPILNQDTSSGRTTGERDTLQDLPSACRVLIVDDNVDSARMTKRLLELKWRLEVRLAYDGAEAIEAAVEFRPHVVLLDIGLPEMDGYHVALRLRELRELQDVILVAVTGYGQAEDRHRALEAGFDHHLVKPASIDELQEVFQAVGGDRSP